MRRAWTLGDKERRLDWNESQIQTAVAVEDELGDEGQRMPVYSLGHWVDGGTRHRDAADQQDCARETRVRSFH